MDVASKQPVAQRNGDGQQPSRTYARRSSVLERACPTRPVVAQVADKFLACGVLDHGFAGIRCDACTHEYLLAFSCMCRYCCPSCHAKRLAIWTQWLYTTLLAPVPHRQVVLTIPQRLRAYCLYRRRLLGEIARVAARAVLRLFVRLELFDEDHAAGMLTWPHSGFHVQTAVWVPEDDRAFATRLARYCARNPVALERLTYDRSAKAVTYRSDKSEGPTAGTETADPLEFLARVLVHIPDKGHVTTRPSGSVAPAAH